MVSLGKEGPAGHGVLLARAVAASCSEPRVSTGTRADGGTCISARPQTVATGSGPPEWSRPFKHSQSESPDIQVGRYSPALSELSGARQLSTYESPTDTMRGGGGRCLSARGPEAREGPAKGTEAESTQLLRTVTGEGGAAVSEKVPGDRVTSSGDTASWTFQRVSSRQKQMCLRAGLKG